MSQATQVFFAYAVNKPGWKVVLYKEAQSRMEVVDTPNVFITTTLETRGLRAPDEVLGAPETPSLLGATQLLAEDHMLAVVAFHM